MADLNEEWTADIVKRMHVCRITNIQLAEACGYKPPYLCTVLNGRKEFSSEENKQNTINTIVSALEKLEEKVKGEAENGV